MVKVTPGVVHHSLTRPIQSKTADSSVVLPEYLIQRYILVYFLSTKQKCYLVLVYVWTIIL